MNTLKNWLTWLWSVRSEAILVIIALIGFAHLAGWLRAVDPTAAPLDLGILSFVAVGIVGVVSSIFLFWVLWRICFPKEIDDWFDRHFVRDFLTVPPAVRLWLFFGTLWAVLLAVSLVTVAAL